MAILSLGAIWLAVGYFVGDIWGTQVWIKNAIMHSSAGTGLQLMPADKHPTLFGFDPHTAMYFVSGTFGLVGLTIAWWLHCANRKSADDLRNWLTARGWIAWLPRAMEHKWYVDEIYIATIRFPLWITSQALYMFDRVFVDGIAVNGTARLPKIAASIFQPLYNGKLQGYATSMAGGLALVIAWIVWVWMRGSV